MQTAILNSEPTQAQRRQAIIDALSLHGEVRVVQLSQNLNTSVVTIRKDLDELEKDGFLERVHGGAVKSNKLQKAPLYIESLITKREEKKAIAKAAAKLINDGDSVIINVGSTTLFVAQELKNKKNLIVITNALMVINELSTCKNITTILLGGRFDLDMQITIGEDTIEQLSKYKADKLIIGMDGVDLEAGATTYNHVEDSVMGLMMERSKERILVADDSKFGRVTFAHIAPLKDFTSIVTNYVPNHAELYKKIENLGVEVITA